MSGAPRSVYSIAVTAIIAAALLVVFTLHIVTTFEVPFFDEPTQEAERHREELSRTAAKRLEAVEELLAGRRSLSETAARFRELTEESPFDTLQGLRISHPGYSDDELHYVHVLAFVEAHCGPLHVSEEKLKSLRDEFELWRKSGGCWPPRTEGTERY
jgi:hypothetical protein